MWLNSVFCAYFHTRPAFYSVVTRGRTSARTWYDCNPDHVKWTGRISCLRAMVLTQTQLALFLNSWSGLMPNKNMKIVVLGNMYFAGRRWWSRYWERRRHSDKDAVFLVWRCCSVDHLTARACAKSGWVCRSLKGVFVRKMSGINSWQNVKFWIFRRTHGL